MNAPSARAMPHDVEAERAVLGSMLMDNNALDAVTEIMTGTDFYVETNRLLFQSMLECSTAGEPIDELNVINRLKSNGNLERIGGTAFITALTSGIATSAHVESYARIVRNHSRVRQVAAIGRSLESEALTGVSDVNAYVDRAQASILAVGQDTSRPGMTHIQPLLVDAYARVDTARLRSTDITGVPTGLRALDAMTCGLQPQNLIVIGAHTSHGKTSLALQMARHAAFRAKIGSAFFSLEMSNTELVDRIICSEASVNGQSLRTGKLTPLDWQRMAEASRIMSASPFYSDERTGLTPMEIAATCRRLVREKHIGLVVIDQLSHVEIPLRGTRAEDVGAASGFFKSLARSLNIPLVLVVQLNDGNAERKNNRPALRDLRESKKIGHDADVVILVHRDDAYGDGVNHDGMADLILAKQRNGPTGNARVKWERRFARFENMDDELQAPAQQEAFKGNTKPTTKAAGGYTYDPDEPQGESP